MFEGVLTKLQSLGACRSACIASDARALPPKYQLEQDGLHLDLSSWRGKTSEWKPEVLVQPGRSRSQRARCWLGSCGWRVVSEQSLVQAGLQETLQAGERSNWKLEGCSSSFGLVPVLAELGFLRKRN